MADTRFNTSRPTFDDTVFVAPTATVIGDVTLGEGSSIWYGACVRGDLAPIQIGAGSNVQENASIHVDFHIPVRIGDGVTIGHNAVVHGATVESHCLIGMGSIVLNGAVVGKGSLVAAGAVVPQGMQIPPGSLVAGVPAKVIKPLSPAQQAHLRENAAVYVECARAHHEAVTG